MMLVLGSLAVLRTDYSVFLRTVGFLLLAGGVAALGWWDDRHTVTARRRLLIQAGLALVLVLWLRPLVTVALPGVVITLPVALAAVLNVIWVVALTNLYNFMDGLDGLAGSQAVIAAVGWVILLLAVGLPTWALLSAVLACSSLGFLVLNKPPAKVFMGDVGSTFLGFVFAGLPLLVAEQVADSRLWVLAAFLVAPFLLDGTFTIVRRAIQRENILAAHRSHVYQRLAQQWGNQHARVTGLYAGYALLSVAAGLVVFWVDAAWVFAGAVALVVLCFVGLLRVVSKANHHRT
jgi:UDP-N-acetylmuramyl pentapeptide phosphotransferase/UDP-N-acetylglucosamine-1-phosphate transferase